MLTLPTGRSTFTLIELLIAIVLSSFILVAIAAGFSTVIRSRKILNAHTDDIQELRQLYLETASDFANARPLPVMDATMVRWEEKSLRFPSLDLDGNTGIVCLDIQGDLLWKTWIPIDISKQDIVLGRLVKTVNLDDLKGVTPVAGQKHYAIAQNLKSASFRYEYKKDLSRHGADLKPLQTENNNTDKAIYHWPVAVTIEITIQENEGSSPLQIKWICPLIQECPWRFEDKPATEKMSAEPF